jgi:cytochrome c peroxidase
MALRATKLLCVMMALFSTVVGARTAEFDEDQIAKILSLGPWPAQDAEYRDPTNRVSGNPQAVEFGKRLFDSPKLSINQKIACRTCHKPELGFSDGRVRAQGLGRHDRNSQSLWNLDLQRWFGWDGGADSLWAASIRPILTRHEMGASPEFIRRQVLLNRDWRERYQELFGASGNADEVLVNVGKSLAAYLETLRSPVTDFDRFRNALAAGKSPALSDYSEAARRGLKLFVGRGNCTFCHFGPALSNGEFHDVAIPFLIAPGRVDPGRHAGVRRVKSDPYNLLSRYNDQRDVGAASTTRLPEVLKTQTVQSAHRNWGEWKTPSLRNLKQTAPYMHNGSLASLHDVARHYSDIKTERLHSDGEQLLKPLRLSRREIDDLVAFLRSLSP